MLLEKHTDRPVSSLTGKNYYFFKAEILIWLNHAPYSLSATELCRPLKVTVGLSEAFHKFTSSGSFFQKMFKKFTVFLVYRNSFSVIYAFDLLNLYPFAMLFDFQRTFTFTIFLINFRSILVNYAGTEYYMQSVVNE